MIEAPEIFARIYEKHGHRCPMSTLGARLGLAATALDGLPQELRAVYHSRTCALDGIGVTLGCSEENGRLTVSTEGRHALDLYVGERLLATLSLSGHAMALAGDYRRLSVELEQGWEQLSEEVRSVRGRRREEALDLLLPELWHGAVDTLIDIDMAGRSE